jgi:Coenzyme PQQ synthesis protein D (PqqD)
MIEEAPLAAELMLFDPSTSRFFVLNRTMAHVWRHCDGQHTLTAILDTMGVEFEAVDRVVAEQDVRNAVTELESLGLITTAAGGPNQTTGD